MYFAYVIYNQKHDVFYPGFTSDLKKRVARHNSPNNKGWTKRYQPWELLFAEEFMDKKDAVKREKYFRSHAGRVIIRRLINRKKFTAAHYNLRKKHVILFQNLYHAATIRCKDYKRKNILS